jgi:hypothetical protein
MSDAVYRLSGPLMPGQRIQVTERVEAAGSGKLSPLCAAVVKTMRAYRKAGQELVEGQYAGVRQLVPPQLRVPCHIYVLCCPDGVLVRYDAAGEEEPKVRGACPDRDEVLAELAPAFSEQVIHISDNPETYVPKHEGPGFIFSPLKKGKKSEFIRWSLRRRGLPPTSNCRHRLHDRHAWFRSIESYNFRYTASCFRRMRRQG